METSSLYRTVINKNIYPAENIFVQIEEYIILISCVSKKLKKWIKYTFKAKNSL